MSIPVIQIIKKSKWHFINRSLTMPHLESTTKNNIFNINRHKEFIKKVAIWNSTFTVKYGKFRDSIYRICNDFNHNSFDITFEYITLIKTLNKKTDAWLIVNDEDNMISSKVPRLLRKLKGHDLVRWDMFHTSEIVWNKSCLPTGGYAFKLHALEKYKQLLYYHGKTKSHKECHLINDSPLGLIIIQPSSRGILCKSPNMTKQELIEKIKFYVSNPVNVPDLYKNHYFEILRLYKRLLETVI